MSNTVFLSINPKHAEAILSGTKTVEFRRRGVRVREGDTVLLYSASPVRGLVGACTVGAVSAGSPGELWKAYRQDGGITKAEFDSYFKDAGDGFAIRVGKPIRIPAPITLTTIRDFEAAFMPPQSFRYVSNMRIELRQLCEMIVDAYKSRLNSSDSWLAEQLA